MIVINSSDIGTNKIQHNIADTDRQPCWYVEVVPSDRKKDYKWKVGSKFDNKTDEYEFEISSAGDTNNDDFWKRVNDLEFAIELIELFKVGGANSVKDWIKHGCP